MIELLPDDLKSNQKDLKLDGRNEKDGDNYNTMTTIDRQTVVAEELIRSFVRKRLKTKIAEKKDTRTKITQSH